jgi:hypothetical protein
MSTTYSPYKNQSREGARPMSFWLKPAEVHFLDDLSDEIGSGRAEALRTLIHAAMAARRNNVVAST